MNSEKGIFIHAISEAGFSPLLLDYFKALDIGYVVKGYSRDRLIHVHPFHPLYLHVKAAAKASAVQEEKQPTTQAAESMGVAA